MCACACVRVCVCVAHVSFVVAEVDAQHGHGADDRHQRLDRVTVDDWLELLVVFAREAAFVDNSTSVTSTHLANIVHMRNVTGKRRPHS